MTRTLNHLLTTPTIDDFEEVKAIYNQIIEESELIRRQEIAHEQQDRICAGIVDKVAFLLEATDTVVFPESKREVLLTTVAANTHEESLEELAIEEVHAVYPTDTGDPVRDAVNEVWAKNKIRAIELTDEKHPYPVALSLAEGSEDLTEEDVRNRYNRLVRMQEAEKADHDSDNDDAIKYDPTTEDED